MKKIAFINVRYGAGINGGSEVHCRMLAERLRDKYDVEVLTTTLKDFNNPSDQYPAGESHESGITIRRFVPHPGFNGRESRRLLQKSKPVRRLRYWLSQAGVLRLLAAIHPVWNLGFDKETAYQHSTVSYAPDLLRYIEEHRDDYAAFIPMCYFHAQTIFAGLQVPQKSILIPMAHPEKWLFPAIYTRLFTQVRHIAFNTEAERRLYLRIFGPRLAPSSIVGTGIELAPAAAWEHVKAKFNLPDKYALYLGRVTTGKINTLLPDFQTYNRTYKQQSKLVLVGSLSPEIKYPDDPNIILTGFVSEEEKSAIIRHATLMVNPSRFESLSLLLLEAMQNRVPVLVNGASEVLKDHCLQSGAALYYKGRRDFCRQLHKLFTDERLRREISEKGPAYVEQNYSWEVIVRKLSALIESI